jgi:hypothetical protein
LEQKKISTLSKLTYHEENKQRSPLLNLRDLIQQYATTTIIEGEACVPCNTLLLPEDYLIDLTKNSEWMNLFTQNTEDFIIDSQLPLTTFIQLIGSESKPYNFNSISNLVKGNTFFLKTFWIKFISRYNQYTYNIISGQNQVVTATADRFKWIQI